MERRVNREDVIGRQVGRYTIVGHLATGGMAELYVARQEAVGGFEKNLVIKVLQSRYAQHPRVERMFLDEARLAAKLNHPSIVHVYDVAEEDGNKFIAMEYIHGETLTDIIKRGVEVGNFLPLEHAVHIVSQVAAGLDYAHRRHDPSGGLLRIVHRDVSPSNIMVSYEGQTKIIDFGIARVQDQIREESGMHPGKASYMSPEQVAGEPVDYRSDIFSLGIILFETTLGRRLWRGPAEEVMKRIASEPAPAPSSIRPDYPAALEAIVMKALERRPDDRQQSAEELRHDLEEFLAVGGFRTGARQASLYLRELFPIKAALSDEGIVQPKGPMEGDSAPLPIVSGVAGDGRIGGAARDNGGGAELSPGAMPPGRRTGSSFPTVLPAGGTRSIGLGTSGAMPVVAPRGPSGTKLALIFAAITFVGFLAVIFIARSRHPDPSVASPPANLEPVAEAPGKSLAELRKQEPSRLQPAKPGSTKPAATRSEPPAAPAERPTPGSTPAPAATARAAAPSRSASASAIERERERDRERARNRRPRHTVASAETASRNSSSSAIPTPSSPAPSPPAPTTEAPRSAPAPEPQSRRPAPATPPAETEPTVAERAPTSSPPPGFVDPKAVIAVVRAHSAEVQGCFDRALMEHADLHGRLTLRASIDPGGRVLAVTPTVVMQGGGRLQSCVAEAFGHWSFPPPTGGVKGTVTYSFSFE